MSENNTMVKVEKDQIINGLDDYNKMFKKQIQDDERNKEKESVAVSFIQKKALDMALDTRKFEIELYWKRATYFWAFIALAFGAYFMVFKEFDLKSKQPAFYNEALLAISIFGLFLSCCWYLVNKGAKYWQENWEKHVDLLEDEIMGPLYKTTVDNKQNWIHVINPFCSYRYSVGKINLLLSSFVIVVWFILFVNRLSYIFDWPEKWTYLNEGLVIGLGIIFLLLLFIGCTSTGSNGAEKYEMKKRELKQE